MSKTNKLLFFYLGTPLFLLFTNCLFSLVLCNKILVNEFLEGWYFYVWPFNVKYISALKYLGVDFHSIIYVVLVCSNAVVILIAMMMMRIFLHIKYSKYKK